MKINGLWTIPTLKNAMKYRFLMVSIWIIYDYLIPWLILMHPRSLPKPRLKEERSNRDEGDIS